jgi:hypothetical protein
LINIFAFSKILNKSLYLFCLLFFIHIVSPIQAKVFDFNLLKEKSRHHKFTAHSPSQINFYTKEAINYLDDLAIPFNNLKCAANDDFCWWVLFHVSIGESGNKQMKKFATSVPFNYHKNVFAGESHIAQYSAYWLLKRLPLNTILTDSQTINEYILRRDWVRDFWQNEDKEPSWYFMVNRFYTRLPQVSPVYPNTERACQGGHYLVGLSTQKHLYKPLFDYELRDYYFRLKQTIQTFKPQDLHNPVKADLISHGMETLCLSGHRELIDESIFYTSLYLVQTYSLEIERERKKYTSPEAFLKGNRELAYSTAELLGHFRNGLKVCAGFEKQL